MYLFKFLARMAFLKSLGQRIRTNGTTTYRKTPTNTFIFHLLFPGSPITAGPPEAAVRRPTTAHCSDFGLYAHTKTFELTKGNALVRPKKGTSGRNPLPNNLWPYRPGEGVRG